MSEHTPGPWRAYLLADSTSWFVNSGPSTQRNEVEIQLPAHWASAEANARLIAAAPDMLAALERALDCLTTESPFASGSPLDGEIRAAIAKARGKA